MFSYLKVPARLLAATLAIAGLLVPAMASAQYAPSYAQPQDQTIHGRIYSINATFNITVTDDNGYMDNVELHQGTVINPTGLTLAPGMEVTIIGYDGGQAFEANEIDTPYTYYGPRPVPVYYGPGYWYPGYEYGYGPSFLLDVVLFGGGFRYERHDFNRGLWAVRSDDRYRGDRGFAPRTVPRNDGGYRGGNTYGQRTNTNAYGNRGYTQRPDTTRGSSYSAPAHTWNNNTNANVNVNANVNQRYNGGYGNSNYRGNTAPARTWNGNPNAGTTYSGRNNGSGNTGYRSAPQQSRPAYTRSAGSNESRNTNASRSSDSGSKSDHSDRRSH